MSDLINIRLTKECPFIQAMDTQAKGLGWCYVNKMDTTNGEFLVS